VSIRVTAVHDGAAIGGAPVSLVKLLAALDQAEFAPLAIFTRPGAMTGYASDLGVRTVVVPAGGAFYYSAHARLSWRMLARFVRTFPGAVRAARQTLRNQRPDILHLNTSVLVGWAVAARRERVPVVWTVREVLGPNRRVRAWHANFILRHACRVVAISSAVGACFPAPVDRVYNGVDLTYDFHLGRLRDAPVVRRELGIAPETPLIVLVGAVQRPKGHWLMLDALGRLDESVHLVLLTGGTEPGYASTPRGRIKRILGQPLDNLDRLLMDARARRLTDRIHVTGFRRDVARVLAAADVAIFTSLEPEGFGRPIIEAMALARPVVATDVGPSAEILGPDAGRLVPPDADRLASAISGLLACPSERARMGQAGRARAEACFSLQRQVHAMSTIYREVARFA
jgi:glycosyltransferase involved in cell wall biosynthesis